MLVGVTGLGLLDYKTTPLGECVPGVEIHAQVIENIFDGVYLRAARPAPLARGARCSLARGFLLIAFVPRCARAAVVGLLVGG